MIHTKMIDMLRITYQNASIIVFVCRFSSLMKTSIYIMSIVIYELRKPKKIIMRVNLDLPKSVSSGWALSAMK